MTSHNNHADVDVVRCIARDTVFVTVAVAAKYNNLRGSVTGVIVVEVYKKVYVRDLTSVHGGATVRNLKAISETVESACLTPIEATAVFDHELVVSESS